MGLSDWKKESGIEKGASEVPSAREKDRPTWMRHQKWGFRFRRKKARGEGKGERLGSGTKEADLSGQAEAGGV